MKAIALEIRDEGTFISALAVDMNPGSPYPPNGSFTEAELEASLNAHVSRTYLLRRCGYPCDGMPNILLTNLNGHGWASNDPYSWGARTMSVAHDHIIKHWSELRDGDVIDVQHILGETTEPKKSEREEVIHAQ